MVLLGELGIYHLGGSTAVFCCHGPVKPFVKQVQVLKGVVGRVGRLNKLFDEHIRLVHEGKRAAFLLHQVLCLPGVVAFACNAMPRLDHVARRHG